VSILKIWPFSVLVVELPVLPTAVTLFPMLLQLCSVYRYVGLVISVLAVS